jgi:mercuric transport protein
MNGNENVAKTTPKLGMAGAVLAAIAASICCIGPFVLLLLGVSGAWISTLTVLEPFRPIFIAMTLGFLGFAFYKVYRKPAEETCEPGSACAKTRFRKGTRIALWIVTVLVILLLSAPYIISSVYAATKSERPKPLQEVTLKVDNMTCKMCTITIRKALTRLDGVKEAKVTLDPPMAVVRFDSSLVHIVDLLKATKKAGYPSKPLPATDRR